MSAARAAPRSTWVSCASQGAIRLDPLSSVRAVLRWCLRLVDATALCLLHVAIASGLFLLSAFILAQSEQDAATAGRIVRGLAAIWMWSALWHYVWRGVLQRPKASVSGRAAASGVRAVASTLGCLGSVGAMAAIYVLAGPWADWAYAGLAGQDGAHPARAALERGLARVDAWLADPAAIRRAALGVGGVIAIYAIVSALAREPKPGPKQGAAGTREPAAPVPRGGAPLHTRGSKPGAKPPVTSIDDPVLGRLRWDGRAGGWRPAEQREGLPGLVVRTDGTPPTEAQRDLARALLQRTFETLLRGSEAARPAATANGIGLPRFTLREAVVEPDTGRRPAVMLTLRCEGDPGRTYTVRSVNGMDTFTLV
jgi:hypothetical protein